MTWSNHALQRPYEGCQEGRGFSARFFSVRCRRAERNGVERSRARSGRTNERPWPRPPALEFRLTFSS